MTLSFPPLRSHARIQGHKVLASFVFDVIMENRRGCRFHLLGGYPLINNRLNVAGCFFIYLFIYSFFQNYKIVEQYLDFENSLIYFYLSKGKKIWLQKISLKEPKSCWKYGLDAKMEKLKMET